MSTLTGKNAIIYGGGGSLGAATAAVFAREGATVHLVGRSKDGLDLAASTVPGAQVAVVDATDEAAVDAHLADVAAHFGSVDVSFNLVKRGDVQGAPITDVDTADFLRVFDVGLRSLFVTARAAARHMIAQGSGVILHLNSGSAAGAAPGMGSTGPADAASEALLRQIAMENGPAGVRVAGIWTAAVAESLTREKMAAVGGPNVPDPSVVVEMISSMAALRRAPRLADVAETAAFLASDRAGGITGSMVNVSCGLTLR